MKGLDKALVGHVYKVKKDYSENTLSLYPEIFKGLSKLTGNYTIR